MAGDVAAVFTGLVGVAEDHILDGVARHLGAGQQFADHLSDQVVRAYRRQGTAVSAEGVRRPA